MIMEEKVPLTYADRIKQLDDIDQVLFNDPNTLMLEMLMGSRMSLSY